MTLSLKFFARSFFICLLQPLFLVDDFFASISIISTMRKFLIIFLALILSGLSVAAKQTQDSTINSFDIQKNPGYVGTLPDVTEKYQPSTPASATPVFEAQDGFDDPDKLKPTPRDNPAFINIMVKEDKASQYLNDINKIIPILQGLVSCIDEESSPQIFVAKADTLSLNIDALRRKYDGKPESYYVSFTKLMPVGLHAKSIATLRGESAQFNKYLAYQSSGAIYSPDNVNKQMTYLKKELNDVLVILQQVN